MQDFVRALKGWSGNMVLICCQDGDCLGAMKKNLNLFYLP